MRKILLGLLGLILATTAAAQTTSAPSSGGGGVGTVTSIATGSCLAGGPITGTGTITVAANLTSLTGASKSYSSTPATDNCATYSRSNSGAAMTDTLPNPASVGANWEITVTNADGAAIDTVTPASGNIAGAASVAIPPGMSATFISDGTNYKYQTSQPLPVVHTLISTGVPFGNATTATMGNNGSFTAATSTDIIYPELCLYIPAHWIDGSAVPASAGFYYTVMSSTTAGIVYNNQCTTYPFYPPASLTPFVSTGPGASDTGSTGAWSTPTFTIPANLIGNNGYFSIWPLYVFHNTAGTKTVVTKIDSVLLQNTSRTTSFGEAVTITLQNLGDAQHQAEVTGLPGASLGAAMTAQTFDFTTTHTLLGSCNNAVATDFCILQHLYVTYTYAP